MGYAYVLELSNGKRYYGSTRDIEARLRAHQAGDVKTTTGKVVKLLYVKEFVTYGEARTFELLCKRSKNKKYVGKLFASE